MAEELYKASLRRVFGALNDCPAVISPMDRAEDIAVKTDNAGLSPNVLLSSLSGGDISLIGPFLKIVSFEQGHVLNQPGDEIEYIYFPHDGMVSLLAVMKDGKAIETATVGREGVVGAMAGLGVHITLTRAVVQVPMVASEISAVHFRKVVRTSGLPTVRAVL